MKILMVCAEFPLLSETFVLDQITGLIDRGHDVQILAKRPADGIIHHAQFEAYGLGRRIVYLEMPDGVTKTWVFLSALWRSLARGRMRLARASCAIAIRKIFRVRARPINPLDLLLYADALLQMSRPDIAVCHFGPQGDLAIALRDCTGLNFSVATVFHGHDMSALFRQKGDSVYTCLLSKGELFLPISFQFRERLIALGAPADKVMVQRMALNLDMFGAGARQHRPATNEFTFLSIGRLVEKKGHNDAIEALAICKAAHPSLAIRLVIIGDGPLSARLRALAATLGVADSVVFTGALPRPAVREHLAQADAFVLPSVTARDGDTEGIPVSIMEAMAMGLPVLSTFHSGIPEIVQDGVSGILVSERDPAALGAAMGRLVEAPDFSASMGRAGRDFALANLDLNHWNDLLVERLSLLLEPEQIPVMVL